LSDSEKTLKIYPPEIAFALPTGPITERPAEMLVLMNAETSLSRDVPPIFMCPLDDDPGCGSCLELTPAPYSLTAYKLVGTGLQAMVDMCSYRVDLPSGFAQAPYPPFPGNLAHNFTFDLMPPVPDLRLLSIVETRPDSLLMSAMFSSAQREAIDFQCFTDCNANFSRCGAQAQGITFDGAETEFTLDGLQPLSTYQVACRAHLRARPRVGSNVSSPKIASTRGDENTRLGALNLTATPLCAGDVAGSAVQLYLYPVFDPAISSYQAAVSIEQFPGACADAPDQTWRFKLEATPESKYGSAVGGATEVTLQGAEILASAQLQAVVTPLTSAKRGITNVTVTVANFNVEIEGVEVGGVLKAAGEVEVDENAEVRILAQATIAVNLDTVGVSFGVLGQKVTSAEDLGSQRFAVVVGRVAGLGRNHRVSLNANGAQFGASVSVSFSSAPSISSCEPSEASLASPTEIAVLGSQFGELALLTAVDTTAIAVRVAKIGGDGTNLCGPTTWISAQELRCTLAPALLKPLEVSLYVRDGGDGPPRLVEIAAGVLDYRVPTLDLQPPLVSPQSGARLRARKLTDAAPKTLLLDPFEPLPPSLIFAGVGFAKEVATVGQVWLDGVQTGVPLCKVPLVFISSENFLCDIATPLDTSLLRSTDPDLQLALGDVVSEPLRTAPAPDGDAFLKIYPPVISSVDPEEWVDLPGETLVTVRGEYFGGTDSGGTVRVTVGEAECAWTFFNKTHIDCSLGEDAVVTRFDPFRPRPNGLPVTVSVELGRNGAFGGLTTSAGAGVVRPVRCPVGRKRAANDNPDCEKCPPGEYADGTAWPFWCEVCGDYEFAPTAGMKKCARCPAYTTSGNTSKTSKKNCVCQSGYYARKRAPGTPCSLCEPALNNADEGLCPLDMLNRPHYEINEGCIGGLCPGGLAWPVSKPGAFLEYEGEISNGDRFPNFFWCDIEGACLGANKCAPGHKGLSCNECLPYHYQARSTVMSRKRKTPSGRPVKEVSLGMCTECGPDSVAGFLAIAGFLGVLLFLSLFALWEVVNFKVNPHRGHYYDAVRAGFISCICFPCVACCRHRERRRHAHHLAHGHHHHGDIHGDGKKKRKRKRARLITLFLLIYPSSVGDMVGEIEWDALITQLLTSAHVLYGISLNAVEWPSFTYNVLQITNYFVFALDRYPMDCFLDIPTHIHWIVLTSLPYCMAIFLITMYLIKLNRSLCCAGKGRAKEELKWIPIPVMQVVFVSFFAFVMWHLQLILKPYDCRPCHNPGESCLNIGTEIRCYASPEHWAMVYVTRFLLFGLALYVITLLWIMNMAWRWQKTRPREKMPWYMAGIEPLVADCRGYNEDAGWSGDAVWDMVYRAMDSNEDEEWRSYFTRVVTQHVKESVEFEHRTGKKLGLLGREFTRAKYLDRVGKIPENATAPDEKAA
jgi:hypothetical protein